MVSMGLSVVLLAQPRRRHYFAELQSQHLPSPFPFLLGLGVHRGTQLLPVGIPLWILQSPILPFQVRVLKIPIFPPNAQQCETERVSYRPGPYAVAPVLSQLSSGNTEAVLLLFSFDFQNCSHNN